MKNKTLKEKNILSDTELKKIIHMIDDDSRITNKHKKKKKSRSKHSFSSRDFIKSKQKINRLQKKIHTLKKQNLKFNLIIIKKLNELHKHIDHKKHHSKKSKHKSKRKSKNDSKHDSKHKSKHDSEYSSSKCSNDIENVLNNSDTDIQLKKIILFNDFLNKYCNFSNNFLNGDTQNISVLSSHNNKHNNCSNNNSNDNNSTDTKTDDVTNVSDCTSCIILSNSQTCH